MDFSCGVIEGFYGRPWLQSQRLQLFGNMERWGMNTFMYSPKDDKKHRTAWRELYDEQEMKQLKVLIDACNQHHIQFIYALAPGLDVTYSSKEEVKLLHDKYSQVASLGCTSFAILFDDIPSKMSEPDEAQFSSFADAQCSISNIAFDHLKNLLSSKLGRFFFCPTEYCGRMAKPSVKDSPYLNTIGAKLDKGIDFFWTGPEIISTDFPVESIQELRKVINRKPTIWDNLHANDYDMVRIYLGPYDDRTIELRNELAGILTNPNCEYEANFVPFRTLALYANAKDSYDPRKALEQAIEEWLPSFSSSVSKAPFTKDDITLLCDTFYLPHRHGPRAQAFLQDFVWLANANNSHPEWKSRYESFQTKAAQMQSLYDKMTEIDNRELLYALYGYVWDVKEEMILHREYAHWINYGKKGGVFSTKEFRPRIHRGGFVTDLRRILVGHDNGSFTLASSASKPETYIIRQAEPEDEDALCNVCLKTGNSGADGTAFYDDPKVLGRRWAVPYLVLEPDLAFVLEDSQGVCGYVLGAVNTTAFGEKFRSQWIPKIKALYPNYPKVESGKRDADALRSILEPEFHFPDNFAPYPAHLHIDLLERAQGKGLGTKMIQALERALKKKGVKGVHLEMSSLNHKAFAFYTKLGFSKLYENEEEQSLFLGKLL